MTTQTDSTPPTDGPLLPSWMPGPLALLAWAVLALAFIKPFVPLSDQATGRHLTAGKVILEQQHIPQLDSLSYLYASRDYLDFEWLFDTGSRFIFNEAGLDVLVFLTFAVFALTLCIMLRHLLRNGVSLPPALCGVLLLASANYVHLLARPVILTYFFLALVVALWIRVLAQEKTKSAWCLPLIFLFWANIHPGFASGLLFMGLSLLGAMWDGRARGFSPFKPAWFLLGLCTLVTLANPYGWKLHTLILHQVFHSKSLGQVQEFLPPDFLHPNGAVFALEVVLLSLFVLAVRRKEKLAAREILPLLVFLFFALRTQRHILLFLPVALLPLCRSWEAWLAALFGASWRERCRRYTAIALHARWDAAWILTGLLVLGALFHLSKPPLRIGTVFFTPQAETFVGEHLDHFQRPFTSSIQAGNLLFYFHPRLKVSFDDRVDFYQDNDTFAHLAAVKAEGDWRGFLKKQAFDSALLYPTDPLAERLRHEPGWTEIYSDAGMVIFQAVVPTP